MAVVLNACEVNDFVFSSLIKTLVAAYSYPWVVCYFIEVW